MGAVGPGGKALDLDAIEGVPWRGTELVWRPVRQALGTRIVGMGGYTADRAGQIVIEGHTESEDGMGHEEVYVVLRGRATFTLDGTQLDAPAGTFVAVSDPSVHRRAVAPEPGPAGPSRRGRARPPPRRPAGLRAGRLRVDRARAAAPAHRPGARAPHPRRATSREARRSRRRGGGGVQGARARRRVESPRRDPRAPEAPPRPPGRPRRR